MDQITAYFSALSSTLTSSTDLHKHAWIRVHARVSRTGPSHWRGKVKDDLNCQTPPLDPKRMISGGERMFNATRSWRTGGWSTPLRVNFRPG